MAAVNGPRVWSLAIALALSTAALDITSCSEDDTVVSCAVVIKRYDLEGSLSGGQSLRSFRFSS